MNDYDELYEIYMKTMKCWNCNKEFESSYDRHLDHNHENGLFRSIVCRNCNSYDSIIRFEPNITPKQKKYIMDSNRNSIKVKCFFCNLEMNRGCLTRHFNKGRCKIIKPK